MSTCIYSTASAIKNQLRDKIPELADACMVERQNNLASMIDAAIGKGSEIYCVVSPQRGRNGSENFRKPRFVLSYLVTLYAPALLQDEDSTAADEVIESMVAAIHGFEPANLPSSQTKQFLVVPEFFPARLEGHAVWQMRVLLPSQGVTLSFE